MSNFSPQQLKAFREAILAEKQKELLLQNKAAANNHLLKIQLLLAQRPLRK
jgi:hypothetical protein